MVVECVENCGCSEPYSTHKVNIKDTIYCTRCNRFFCKEHYYVSDETFQDETLTDKEIFLYNDEYQNYTTFECDMCEYCDKTSPYIFNWEDDAGRDCRT